MAKMMTYTCTECGKVFQRGTSRGERTINHFCNVTCHGLWLKGKPGVRKTTQAQRFWAKVNKKGPNECWTWAGNRTTGGYGAWQLKAKFASAHRIAWMLTYGPIPEGEGHHGTCVCHRCDNRLCVNPNHLFLGNHTENMQDMEKKGRAVHFPGSTNPRARLTDTQVREIRSNPEIPPKALAVRFNVSTATISSIRKGKTWRNIL